MTLQPEAIRTWDVATCHAQVRRLFTLADDLDGAYEQLCRTEAGLAGWDGPAANRARPRLRLAAVIASRLAGRLRQAADAVRLGLGGLAEAARLARAIPQSGRESAEATAAAVAVDRRVAAGLAAAAHGAPAMSGDQLPLPAPGETPAGVARWWTALPPHLRQLMLTQRPAAVGRLAGLPAAVRDAANRLQLTRLLHLLRAECRRLGAAVAAGPAGLRRAVTVRAMLLVAEDTERQLAALERDGRPARLLTLDLQGAGRVAIGVGDLDHARHVAVLVPGMGQDAAHGIARTVELAVRLRDQAGRESAEPSAAIAWVGYPAPGLAQVPFAARARGGGQLLTADLRALAASREIEGGEPPHVTLVGHSYGSTVVGAAACAAPIPADDLVLLGSPGVLADHVDDLGYGQRHVFVGEAPFDLVADLGAFGADPGDARFGATRIRADPGVGVPWVVRLSGGDHSHYFDLGSESLRNVARVVVGRTDALSRPPTEGEP